ncbi:MAG: hypothetical protein RDV48_16605 [Candidatus Eremiobacteraeota bacterium]|nr:hypothetical protein [Candidatus Eremiobacteraeota bacterium]
MARLQIRPIGRHSLELSRGSLTGERIAWELLLFLLFMYFFHTSLMPAIFTMVRPITHNPDDPVQYISCSALIAVPLVVAALIRLVQLCSGIRITINRHEKSIFIEATGNEKRALGKKPQGKTLKLDIAEIDEVVLNQSIEIIYTQHGPHIIRSWNIELPVPSREPFRLVFNREPEAVRCAEQMAKYIEVPLVDRRGEREWITGPGEIGAPLVGRKATLPCEAADVQIEPPPSTRVRYECDKGRATFTLPGNGIKGFRGLGVLCGFFLPAFFIFIQVMIYRQEGGIRKCLEGVNALYTALLLAASAGLWAASIFAMASYQRIIVAGDAIFIETVFAGRRFFERSIPLSRVKGIREERCTGAIDEVISIECEEEMVKVTGFLDPAERIWLAQSLRALLTGESARK